MDNFLAQVGVASLAAGTLFSVICLIVASKRGLDKSIAFVLGFFLGPIGLIVVCLMKPSDQRQAPLSFNGNADIDDSRYQLFLTKKYVIEKNDVLGKFTVRGNTFDTLEQSLLWAKDAEAEQSLIRRKRNLEAERSRKRNLIVVSALAALAFAVWGISAVYRTVSDHQAAQNDRKVAVAEAQRNMQRAENEKQQAVNLLSRSGIILPPNVAADMMRQAGLDKYGSCSDMRPVIAADDQVFTYMSLSHWSGPRTDYFAVFDLLDKNIRNEEYAVISERNLLGQVRKALYRRGDFRVHMTATSFSDGGSVQLCLVETTS